MTAKTIRIHLSDGTPNGILMVEIAHWTGNIFVAPRELLRDLADFEETQGYGVYVLMGEDNTAKEVIYIGESNNVLNRLAQHIKDPSKDFWNRTIIITNKDGSVTESHVRYLESRLIERAKKAQRAKIVNGTAPEPPILDRFERASMEEFLSQLDNVLSLIGFSFMTPQPTVSIKESTIQDDTPVFHYSGNGFNAEAQVINGQFVVQKTSLAKKNFTPALGRNYTRLRAQLITEGKIVEDNDGFRFTSDVEFSAPTPAACIICGTSVNGRDAWRQKKTGETYNQWSQRQLEQSGIRTEDEPE